MPTNDHDEPRPKPPWSATGIKVFLLTLAAGLALQGIPKAPRREGPAAIELRAVLPSPGGSRLPCPGLLVEVVEPDSGRIIASARTDGRGGCRLEVPRYQRVRVQLSRFPFTHHYGSVGFLGGSFAFAEPVELKEFDASAERTELGDVELEPPAPSALSSFLAEAADSEGGPGGAAFHLGLTAGRVAAPAFEMPEGHLAGELLLTSSHVLDLTREVVVDDAHCALLDELLVAALRELEEERDARESGPPAVGPTYPAKTRAEAPTFQEPSGSATRDAAGAITRAILAVSDTPACVWPSPYCKDPMLALVGAAREIAFGCTDDFALSASVGLIDLALERVDGFPSGADYEKRNDWIRDAAVAREIHGALARAREALLGLQ